MDINTSISSLDWQREPQGLYAPIAYTLASGGKRLRPQLALIACRIAGGNEQKALPLALAIELFHNFTLMHDDVMDDAPIRRGRPTVHVKWNANTAILSGDQMLIEAYKQLEGVESQYLPEVLHLFSKMATEICEGQQYDVDFEQREQVRIEEYIEMIRLKTSVLLATALQVGALVGGANEDVQKELYDFGIHLGLAFQIQDDLLDCFGDPATFGKAIGGDICCNKKTFLLLTAFSEATTEQQQALLEQLHAPASQEKIDKVKALYLSTGARGIAESAISAHTDAALACLRRMPQNEATKQLAAIAKQLVTRNS